MSDLPNDPIGAAWLAQVYQLLPTGRMPVQSQIGGRRATQISDGDRLETSPEAMPPSPEPPAHLPFHLRHATPHPEFLPPLFAKAGPAFVHALVDAEPPRLHYPREDPKRGGRGKSKS